MLALLLGIVFSSLLPLGASDSTDVERCVHYYDQANVDDTWRNLIGNWQRLSPSEADSLWSLLPLLERSRSCLGDRRPDVIANSYWNETYIRASLQQFPETFAAFDAFFNQFRTLPANVPDSIRTDLRERVALMRRARGYLHYRLGDLAPAIADYAEASSVMPASEVVWRLQLLVDLGVIVLRTDDHEGARRYFREAVRLAEQSASSEEEVRIQHARALADLADLILSEHGASISGAQLDRARELVEQSKAIYSEKGNRWSALQNLLLGRISSLSGDYGRARDHLAHSLSWARAEGEVSNEMIYLRTLGAIELRAGNADDAERHLTNALEMARSLGDLERQRGILHLLGTLSELQGDLAQAEAWYRDAVEVIEEYRSSLRATQWSLTAFSGWQEIYRSLVRSLLAQNRPAEAFRILERTRGRHLTDLRIQQKISQDLPPAQRVRYDSLTQAIEEVRTQLSRSASAQLDSLRSVETKLVAQRRGLLPFSDAPDAVNVDALQTALRRQGQTLVSYFVDTSPAFGQRPTRSHAFVLTADTLRAVPLPGVTEASVSTTLSSVSPLFAPETSRPTGISGMHFDLRPLHDLYERLFAPVEPHLRNNRAVVIPDGPLFRLPFPMLVSERPARRFAYDDASFLLDRYATSVELSASLLADAQTSTAVFESKTHALAAFGVSRFDRPRPIPTALRSAMPGVGLGADPDASEIQLASLPGVRRELQSLRSLVAGGRFALDDDATESAFHATENEAKILHLASHAFVHASSPLYNAFALAPGDSSESPRADGWLFLHEIQSDADDIPLVYLSGCSTAEGTLRSGEGMEGLQYAFRAMGARSTVSNLWPVDDDAAVELTRSFYRLLGEGVPKDIALQKAQARYLSRHRDRSSPFFWASTVLYGSPESIPLERPSLPVRLYHSLTLQSTLIFGVSLLLVVGGVLFVRRRVRPS